MNNESQSANLYARNRFLIFSRRKFTLYWFGSTLLLRKKTQLQEFFFKNWQKRSSVLWLMSALADSASRASSLFLVFFSATIFYEHSLTFVWRQREILLNFYEHEAINWRRCIYFPFSCSRKIKIKEIPGKKAKAPVSYVTWIVSMYSICLLHHNSPVNAFPRASLFRCNFEYTKT